MSVKNKPNMNQLCNDILFVIACSAAVEREDLNVLNPSYKYVSNMVSELINNGLISYMRNDAKILRLTKAGINYLKETNPELYSFNMQLTNDGQHGHSKRHKELMIRNAGVQACMLMAGIDTGPFKPAFYKVDNNQLQKMNIAERPTYYMGKEIRYQSKQRTTRAHLSRSSGILFSQGATALVYNAVDASMKISIPVEKETSMLARVWSTELYGMYLPPGYGITDTIVMCRGDDVMLSIMENCAGGKSTVKMIGDVISNPTLTNTTTRYIPISAGGILSLKLISTYTKEEIVNLFFTKEEQQSVPTGYKADAISNGILCYEFLSCDVSKLAFIKSMFPQMKWEHGDIGVVCWDEQADFILRYFNVPSIRLRRYPRSTIESLLKGE